MTHKIKHRKCTHPRLSQPRPSKEHRTVRQFFWKFVLWKKVGKEKPPPPWYSNRPLGALEAHCFLSTKALGISGLKENCIICQHNIYIYSCACLWCPYFNILPAVWGPFHSTTFMKIPWIEIIKHKNLTMVAYKYYEILQSNFSNSAEHDCQQSLSCLKSKVDPVVSYLEHQFRKPTCQGHAVGGPAEGPIWDSKFADRSMLELKNGNRPTTM